MLLMSRMAAEFVALRGGRLHPIVLTIMRSAILRPAARLRLDDWKRSSCSRALWVDVVRGKAPDPPGNSWNVWNRQFAVFHVKIVHDSFWKTPDFSSCRELSAGGRRRHADARALQS
jgi:hypothetical protein